MINNIPSYEELKQIKEHKIYSLYFPLIGGYFRLVINEEGEHNIAIDYLEKGYLSYINYKFGTDYSFSRLYKFNKKNYDGLVKLYKKMINVLYEEVKNYKEVIK